MGDFVASCGDDISLIMTHGYGIDSELIHSFAWDTFQTTTNVARERGLYGAGQDLLSDVLRLPGGHQHAAALPHLRQVRASAAITARSAHEGRGRATCRRNTAN
jgi:hypothetical protein